MASTRDCAKSLATLRFDGRFGSRARFERILVYDAALSASREMDTRHAPGNIKTTAMQDSEVGSK